MTNPNSSNPKNSLDPERLERLRAEAKAPFRGLRQFFYIAFAASALLGGFIFFFKLLAGEDFSTTFFNLMVQLSVFGLMVGLLWLERRPS
ncbi:hypothetical protein C1752_06365 [Acaryochloris thomasi RCC1774]|uniref:DUF3493 domain-containing protein n=1 Tax=Acaryochloris thomasi RCC1774 TaxID=1764569 RepID=A0A2W1JC79_9CYAN|nr:DUF3493 domain-containing protein [Acaryochloris thomasi]PZD71488.1 hypothetical protein C1752_06365 [Acaryochloris thomasi RCC1774]